jgi:16S rRNA (cytosine967-C5)-methyltransferase
MLASARIDAVIDLTEEVAKNLKENGAAADVSVRSFFDKRRYAGSKDRRYITNKLYDIIRRWGFLYDISSGLARRMVLAELSLCGEDVKSLFTGEQHAPSIVTDEELTFLKTVHPEQEDHHKLNYPLWLEDDLKDRFGDKFEKEMNTFNDRAPLTLRIVRNRKEIEAFLEEKEVEFIPGIHANSALIIQEHVQIRDWAIYKNGLVEIQDEAAQLAVKLAEIKPGQQVMDLCAGAGGKTLAAAAYMQNKGQVYAFDIVENKLKELKTRAKRAKIHILQSRVLTPKNREKTLSDFVGKMDRVIVDVPCSGTGTWRRNPEARWRITKDSVNEYATIQAGLMDEAWQMTKVGGRMVYMTCSILKQENENQIEQFLKNNNDAKLVPIRKQGISSMDGTLLVSPYSRQMDGFYVAILEKQAD